MSRAALRSSALLATVLLASLALAGCAGSKKTTEYPATASVDMKNTAFDPQTVTIKAGGTVTWVNKDAFPHDVTGEGGAWQSTGGPGAMDKDATFSKTFDTAGTYQYYCTLHSSGPGNLMWGKVVVK